MFHVDWQALFALETPLSEIFLRGTVMYLGLLVLARFFLRRQSGSGGLTDILVMVLLADAAQNAMADDYKTITDGLLLVVTILFWSFAIDWLAYRVKFMRHFAHPAPLLIVKDGKMLLRNMRKELITKDELMNQIRAEGVDDIKKVKEARMEGDGQITVIKK